MIGAPLMERRVIAATRLLKFPGDRSRTGVHQLRRYGTWVGVIALAYFASALVGNALKFTGNVDALWPPVGIVIAILYRYAIRYWPGVLICHILADCPHSLPFVASPGQPPAN